MGARHKSREAAMKTLYQADMRPGEDMGRPGLSEDELEANIDPEFVRELVDGVIDNIDALDAAISGALVNWDLGRLGYLERAIMRLGAFEILFQPATPDSVAIDEALELAKSYCEAQSPRLINGVLDKIAQENKTRPANGGLRETRT